MPNHCENRLFVTGPTKSVERFVKAVWPESASDEVRLTNVYPMPEVLSGTQSPAVTSPDPNPVWATWVKDGTWTKEQYDLHCAENRLAYTANQLATIETGYPNWYEWALANWGTKWGDYDHSPGEVISNGQHAEWEVTYMTAWAPLHLPFWVRVSQQFPDLTISVTYIEPGMVYCGAMGVSKGGEVAIDEYVDDYAQHIGGPYDEPDIDPYNDEDIDLWERRNDAVHELMDELHNKVLEQL